MKRTIIIGCIVLFSVFVTGYGVYGQCPGSTAVFTVNFTDSCGPNTPVDVILTNTSFGPDVNATAAFDWYQNGAYLQFSSFGDPPITVTLPGHSQDTFLLVSSDANGCVDSAEIAVNYTSGGVVVANFTQNDTNICQGQSVTFTDVSMGANLSYDWDFGDGMTSTSAGPHTIAYANIGNFNVSLDVTSACGTDQALSSVNVTAGASVGFTLSTDTICLNDSVQLFNNSVGIVNYTLNFGDGNTTNVFENYHSYMSAGTGIYYISLSTTDMTCGPSSVTDSVVVLPAINLAINGDDGNGDTRECLPYNSAINTLDVNFSNTTTGAVSYAWNFGDGSPIFNTNSTATFSHQFTTYGSFDVVMTATNAGGCSVSDTIEVVFQRMPHAEFNIIPAERQGCTPLDVHPVDLSLNGDTFTWVFGYSTDSVVSTSLLSVYTFNGPSGAYVPALVVSNVCGVDTFLFFSGMIISAPATADFTTSTGDTAFCAGDVVTFVNTSQEVSTPLGYRWRFGDGTGINAVVNPSHTYSDTGVYEVSLIAPGVCSDDTAYQELLIIGPPEASFSVSSNTGCVPLNPVITDLSIGRGLQYQWFVNGVLVSDADTLPDGIFDANTFNYTILLEVSNGCGMDDTTIVLNYDLPTTAAINVGDTAVCQGAPIAWASLSLGLNMQLDWDFGNGNTANGSGPFVQTYNTVGSDTVILIADGDCGVDTAISVVTITSPPVAIFTTTDSIVGCANYAMSFTNNSTMGAQYDWTFPGASPLNSSLQNPGIVNFNTLGNHQIRLIVSLNGCQDSSFLTVTVNPSPQASYTVNTISGCSPLAISIVNTSPFNPGDLYEWDFGDGNTSLLQDPNNHTYINPSPLVDTTYTGILVVENSYGCTDTASKIFTVKKQPVAGFSVAADSVCVSENVLFTDTSISGYSRVWNFGDGGSATNVSPTHAYNTVGVYQVRLISKALNSCADTTYLNMVVDSTPESNFYFDLFCFGDTAFFNDSSLYSPNQWIWDYGDGSVLDTTNLGKHLYANTGQYNVTLYTENAIGCSSSITKSITINPIPIAGFEYSLWCENQNATFSDTSQFADSWLWDFGDLSVSANQNPNHIYTATGNYWVKQVVSNLAGCKDSVFTNVYVDSVPVPNFGFASSCIGDTTFFNNLSQTTPSFYHWDFGNGLNSNLTNPFIVYDSSGLYSVLLVAQYLSGCKDSITLNVDAFPRTSPGFEFQNVCLNDSVQFTDTTLGNPIMWDWDFGNGLNSSNQHPWTSYTATTGNHLVSLITENIYGCRDTVSDSIHIYDLPVANFGFDSVCDGLSTQFNDLSIGVSTWSWDFGDLSGSLSQQSPMHLYMDSGAYTVELIIASSDGCKDTAQKNILVWPSPNAQFTFDTVCQGLGVSFTNLSDFENAWSWDFSDNGNNSILENPNYIFTQDGYFSVKLVVDNSFSCADSITKLVYVKNTPEAGFTYQAVCAGNLTTFYDTSLGNPNSWQWDFGDGVGVASSQNPSYTYLAGGFINVNLIVGNNLLCFDTITKAVQVNTIPQIDFIFDTICSGVPTTFTDLTVDNVPLNSWLWNFDDGNLSSDQNPMYIFQDSGHFNVNLQVTNSDGCDSSVYKEVWVKFQPTADFTADTVCVGLPTSFADNSTGIPDYYIWNYGDGIIDTLAPNPQHVYSSGGIYVATLTVVQDGCTDQDYAVVYSYQDVESFIVTDDTVCVGELVAFTDSSNALSGFINSWQWYFGAEDSSVAQSPNYQFDTAGTYTITLIVQAGGGCKDTTQVFLNVGDIPHASFALNQVSSCSGQESYLLDLSTIASDSIAAWQWDFGDGNFSTQQDPTHIYAAANTYLVQLEVFSSIGCSDDTVYLLKVQGTPTANFSYDLACPNASTQFTDLSYGSPSEPIVSWGWSFDDGQSSTLQHPVHTFDVMVDSFEVALYVTNNGGCTDTTWQWVNFLPKPVFDFRAINAGGCEPFEASFEDVSYVPGGASQITNWLWSFGDNSFGFPTSPRHVYLEDGTYQVSLTLTTSDGCTYTDSLDYLINVNPSPNAFFTYLPEDSITIMDPNVEFIDATDDAMFWLWDFGDGDTSTAQYPNHTFPGEGEYEVVLTATNQYNCTGEHIELVKVITEFAFYIPNAFTPNGDGKNDVFLGHGVGVKSGRLLIYTRTGSAIFESIDIDYGWDGKVNEHDKIAKQDLYVYMYSIIDVYGNKHDYRGYVMLLKDEDR